MAKSRPLGPYSRSGSLASIDGRTKEAGLLRAVRDDLTAHVGGAPSATQKALIERAAWLSLHVAQLDAKMADNGSMTEHDSRTYLAWSGALSRTLRDLGMKGASTPAPQSLADLLATIPANRPAPAASAPHKPLTSQHLAQPHTADDGADGCL